MEYSQRVGLYLGLFLVVYGLLFRLLNLHYSSAWAWIFYIAPIAAVLWGVMRAPETINASYKISLWSGVKISAIGSLIYSIYVYVYNKFIDDSLLRLVYSESIEKLRDLPDKEEKIRNVELMTTPELFTLGVFVRLTLVGIVFALMFSALRKVIR